MDGLSDTLGNTFNRLGDFSAYCASFELQTKGSSNLPATTLPGRIAALGVKRRIEIDLGAMLTNNNPELSADRLFREKGNRVIFVLRPDKKVYWYAYSYMDGYFEKPMKDSNVTRPESDPKREITKLGNETVDGHPCVKNRVVETDKNGKIRESTVWNAADLNMFPLKTKEDSLIILFKDVKLGDPDAALFEPPAPHKANIMTLLRDLTKLIRDMKNERAITNSW
jgi:hypothetical protein